MLNIPSEQDINNPSDHLIDLLNQSCRQYPERIAFYGFGTAMSYSKLEEYSDDVAYWLMNSSGLSSGDRVAIMLPNLLQYPAVLFGILKAGMIATSINPLYQSTELNHQLKDSGAKVIVIFDQSLTTLSKALGGTAIEKIIVSSVGDLLHSYKGATLNLLSTITHPKAFLKYCHLKKKYQSNLCTLKQIVKHYEEFRIYKFPGIKMSDIAVLQYTGGTTGVAKGAMLTHHNLVSNLMQIRAFFPILASMAKPTVCTALPLYHIFSLTVNCLLFISIAGSNVLIADPRKTTSLIRTLKEYQINVITGVDTLFKSLARHSKFNSLNFYYLKLTIGGGMPVQHDTASHWQKVTGNMILQGYGLTETSPVVCVNPHETSDFNGSVGLPLPVTQISIRSLAESESKVMVTGEHGEIWIKGPQVMAGYWKKSEASASTMEDGWLKTGDIGYIDSEGYIYIVGRKKDLILVSGFNVYPNEIENALANHKEIAEVACIGIPDEHSGQRVKAFVVRTKGSALTKEKVIDFCEDKMAKYKIPTDIVFCKSLPKSNVGKVLHRKLRDTA